MGLGVVAQTHVGHLSILVDRASALEPNMLGFE